MDRKKPIFLLAVFGGILALVALACNMPGQTLTSESEVLSSTNPADSEIIEQELYTENFDTFANQLISEPLVAPLKNTLETKGYEMITGAGYTVLQDGSQLRSISVTDGENHQVILNHVENNEGAEGAFALEFPTEDSMYVWDGGGGIEFIYHEDGTADYILKDSDGRPLSDERPELAASHKLACLSPFGAVGCEMGFFDEFYNCIQGVTGATATSALCVSLAKEAFVLCGATGGALCIPAGLGALIACGYPAYCGIASMIDNKPTVNFMEPSVIRTYKECGDDELYIKTEYKIGVECIDDRDPITPPDPLIVSSSPNNELIWASCTDCSGQESRNATTVPLAEIIKCATGCDTNNRTWCETLDGTRYSVDSPPEQTEDQVSDSYFSGAWFSTQKCDDEFPYTWTISLNQNAESNVNGTIRFCKRDSGYMVYSVSGQAEPGINRIQLEGHKISGDGSIFSSGPTIQTFVFTVSTPQSAPSPNLSR